MAAAQNLANSLADANALKLSEAFISTGGKATSAAGKVVILDQSQRE